MSQESGLRPEPNPELSVNTEAEPEDCNSATDVREPIEYISIWLLLLLFIRVWPSIVCIVKYDGSIPFECSI